MYARLVYELGDQHRIIELGPGLKPELNSELREHAYAASRAGAFDADGKPNPGVRERYQLWIKDGPVPLCEGRTYGAEVPAEVRAVLDWILNHGDPRRVCQRCFVDLLKQWSESGLSSDEEFDNFARLQVEMGSIAVSSEPDAIRRLDDACKMARVWIAATMREREERAKLIRLE